MNCISTGATTLYFVPLTELGLSILKSWSSFRHLWPLFRCLMLFPKCTWYLGASRSQVECFWECKDILLHWAGDLLRCGCPVLDTEYPDWVWITASQGNYLHSITRKLVISFWKTISRTLAGFGVPAGWLLWTILLIILSVDDLRALFCTVIFFSTEALIWLSLIPEIR